MKVFLTGGTGLLGSHLVTWLIEHDHDVVALHRRGAETDFLAAAGVTLAEGDVRDPPAALARAMAGCSHVVHGAALVYAEGSWPKVRAVNVDGTRNVLTAAADAGVEAAIHISSVAVYGTTDGEVDERTPIDTDVPPGDLYARSKREAEAVARSIEVDRGLPVTVLRPSAVYGERDRLMTPAIVDILRAPIVPLFGPGDNTLPVVYAGNVALAIGLAAEAGRGGETFDVAYDHPLTQRELFTGFAAGLGRTPRFFTLPGGLVSGGAKLLARLGVPTPGAKHLPIERVARLALGDNPYPSRRIRQELGWDPPCHHTDALARAAQSLTAARAG